MLDVDSEGIVDFRKPALIALMLAVVLASGTVRAQQPAPAAPQADVVDPAAKPVQKRKPIQRRSVQQVIEPTPPIVTEGYRPTKLIRPPAPLPGSAPVAAPLRLNSCDPGGCTDTSGARYNGGVGNTLLGPQGQLCTRGVVDAQCF